MNELSTARLASLGEIKAKKIELIVNDLQPPLPRSSWTKGFANTQEGESQAAFFCQAPHDPLLKPS